ncbi:hypothetical protein FQN55_007964 [Onygenales sp. PD_40]|nr:hypothetical protein FQN55_007964 [Onygenales sp. PD_40]KAK2783507.1 hypothetical protein FQN52_009627 [Onygenales sp. PD_12]
MAISGLLYKQATPSPSTLYSPRSDTLFRRNATFLASMFVGAFAFEMAFDTGSDKIFDAINRGRQWKDIRHQYIQKAEEEE